MLRWLTACAFLLLFCLVSLTARAQVPPPSWFFAVVSDPQFGYYANDQNFSQETANFEFVVANLNRLHPAFVVVCGDLTDRTDSTTQIAEYKRILKELDPTIPVYNVAGNHDVGEAPSQTSITDYRANFGMDRYTFLQNGLLGVVLDSSLIASPQGYPAATTAQLSWLKTTLASSAARSATQIVVFQHIPYFIHTATEADSYYNIPVAVRGTYLNLLLGAGVSWVFSGHLHNVAGGLDANLDQVVVGTAGKPLGSFGSGLTLVAVNGTALEPYWYCFAGIPNTFDPTHPPTTPCSQDIDHDTN